MNTECDKLVFLHVPKTAGTSIDREMKAYYPLHHVFHERSAVLEKYTYDELKKYHYFSGHFDKYNIDLIPGQKFVFTFLRCPQDRIVSLYYYWRSYREEHCVLHQLHGPLAAKKLTLEEFLVCDDISVRFNIDNVYFRTFTGRHRIEDYCLLHRESADFYADWAMLYLARLNFVGFVEFFEEDILRLRAALEIHNQAKPLKLNRFNDIGGDEGFRSALDEEKYVSDESKQIIADICSVDTLIYQKALSIRLELQNKFLQ